MKWRGFSVWTLLIMGILFGLLSSLIGTALSLAIIGGTWITASEFGGPATLILLGLVTVPSVILVGMLVVVVYQWGTKRK